MEFLTAYAAAQRIGVSRVTIITWARDGLFEGAAQEAYSGYWRIPVAEVERVRAERSGGKQKSA